MALQVLTFPERHIDDVPGALRRLADEVAAGKHGACHQLFWCCDAGEGQIGLGMLGSSGSPAGDAMLLMAAAMKRLLAGIGE